MSQARHLSEKLVCYVCQTIHIHPDDCCAVNVIVAGYGVCLDHQFVIERALDLREAHQAIYRERDREL